MILCDKELLHDCRICAVSAFLSLSLRNHQDPPISAWAGLAVLTAPVITSSHWGMATLKVRLSVLIAAKGLPRFALMQSGDVGTGWLCLLTLITAGQASWGAELYFIHFDRRRSPMEMIFISGCGWAKLMLPLVLKGSAEQMFVFDVLALAGAPNCTSACAGT